MICLKEPDKVMKEIESVYLVNDSSKGPPNYYLGNDYKKDSRGRWCIGSKRYLTEAISRIEAIFCSLPKKDSPMVDGDHPEMDDASPLDDEGHQLYPMLIGMKGHLDQVLRVFGYLKKNKNHRVIVDSRDPIIKGDKNILGKDLSKTFQEFYPDTAEEIDCKIPVPMINEIEITAFVDSDHAHDK
eukprot:15351993-Ditylum_brightwellii.AAC.1